MRAVKTRAFSRTLSRNRRAGSKGKELLAPEPGEGSRLGGTVEAHLAGDRTIPCFITCNNPQCLTVYYAAAGDLAAFADNRRREHAGVGRLADWLAGTGLPVLRLARPLVCPDHRGLGVPVEWL